jgi:hypothetical protein
LQTPRGYTTPYTTKPLYLNIYHTIYNQTIIPEYLSLNINAHSSGMYK